MATWQPPPSFRSPKYTMAPGNAQDDCLPPPCRTADCSNSLPTPIGNNRSSTNNGRIFVLLLLPAFFFLLLMCVCARFRGRHSRETFLSGRTNIPRRRGLFLAREDLLRLRNVGLNARFVDSLPVFEYKAQSFKDAWDCAVCLSEFEENEKVRLLPNCKHSFHVDCIDMWFRSHSTCPICRMEAQPKQWVGHNHTDEISINVELISSSNTEIRIGPGLEEGATSSQEAKTAVDEAASTSGISSMPESPESFSSEK